MNNTKSRPNIILIQSDSHDGRVLGCVDHRAASTPNIDSLAEKGTVFANAYCNSPVCVPSRASMWTSRHTHEVEAWNNDKGIPEDAYTFQTALIAAHYETELIGRLDHHSGRHTIRNRLAGWTRAADLTIYRRDMLPRAVIDEDAEERVRPEDWEIVDQAVEWLNSHRVADPFFLHVGFHQPHPGKGFTTSRHYLDRIDPNKIDLPPRDESRHPVYEYMKRAKCCAEDFTNEEILEIRRHYYSMVAEVDAMIGTVLNAARSTGHLENTYVIYLSDHGELNMEHGQWRKSAMYESSVRVPLVITGPGVKRTSVRNEPVTLLDIFPTLLEMAGLPSVDGLRGRSLLPALRGDDFSSQPVFAQYNSSLQNTGSYMILDGQWKYIAFAGYDPQLFNLIEDPDEIENIAASKPELVADMDRRLRKVIDYPSVDRKAKTYDKARFMLWRREIGEEAYRKTMQEVFPSWKEEHEQQIQAWLATE